MIIGNSSSIHSLIVCPPASALAPVKIKFIFEKPSIAVKTSLSTVFNYGDVGVENIYKMQYMERNQLEKDIGVSLDGEYACVTYHPTTLDDDIPENQICSPI